MIAAIGEGKALGDTAPHDGRVGRPYVNEVVLLRANPGASQAKPPFGWPIGPTLAGTTGVGSGVCRPASNMQATIASLAMRTMGVERPAADFRAKLPASSHLRSSLRVTGAELCAYGSSKAPLFAMPWTRPNRIVLVNLKTHAHDVRTGVAGCLPFPNWPRKRYALFWPRT